MNKERFREEVSEIEFPMDDVFVAINNGMEKGRKEKLSNKKSKLKMIGTISSVAASAFFASGLIFAPITNVFASVPVIGSIYEKFSLQIGHELLESNLITELNQEATSNGVDITLTSAYYDGNVIGITFKAEGKKVSLDSIGDKGPETGYSFHLFDGDEQKQWSGSMTVLEETTDGYVGAMEFYSSDADLPTNFTLPLTFTSITGIKGVWKFDVGVEQIPLETIQSQAESILKEEGYSLQMDSVVKGKATTLLKYKTTSPLVGKDDRIEITVFDNEGNRLSKNHADVISTDYYNGVIDKQIRELFSSKINENAQFLTIQPIINRYEQDTVESLEQRTPFMVESNRFNYKIKVNKIEQNGQKLILDYSVMDINSDTIRKDIIQNFADFIMVIKSENIHRDENGELDMNKTINYTIRSNKAEVKEGEDLHFQSSFEIKDGVDYRDYSLMVPFGTLSLNEDIKMEPIKVFLY